jgi:hypothetical protein
MPVLLAVVAGVVSDTDELVVVTVSGNVVEVSGGFSARLNFTSAPADCGLSMVGESLLRKSR